MGRKMFNINFLLDSSFKGLSIQRIASNILPHNFKKFIKAIWDVQHAKLSAEKKKIINNVHKKKKTR